MAVKLTAFISAALLLAAWAMAEGTDTTTAGAIMAAIEKASSKDLTDLQKSDIVATIEGKKLKISGHVTAVTPKEKNADVSVVTIRWESSETVEDKKHLDKDKKPKKVPKLTIHATAEIGTDFARTLRIEGLATESGTITKFTFNAGHPRECWVAHLTLVGGTIDK